MTTMLAWLFLQATDSQVDEPGRQDAWHDWITISALWVGVFIAAWLANFIAKRVIVRAVRALISRTKATWDDILVEHHVFEKLSHVAPAVVIYAAAPILLPNEPRAADYVQRLANVWITLAAARAVSAFFDGLVTLARRSPSTREKPVRSYVQVANIVLWMSVAIFVVSILMQKSPWALLTGLGAMTAILLLVFKDSILGFVASIQIASNDLVRVGDWIEMSRYGADGDVIDIGLHTVKVQNWDKTVSTIPTPAFMQDSFKNWRGMTLSGGRRIKRSLSLDMTSVHFLSEETIERLRGIEILRPYIDERSAEIAASNKESGVDDSVEANGRRLTNLGTFRAYVDAYLEANPHVHKEMTFLVRQLAPTSEGIPIEIYVFSSEQRWVEYEGIIGDIFDHLLAVLPTFELRVYQKPSGADLALLAR